MNILFLSLTFPDRLSPERGTYNLGLCAALARQHRVHVIAPRSWYEWLSTIRAGGAYRPSPDTEASGVTVDFPAYWYLPKVMPEARGYALWRSTRGAANRCARRVRPDVVVSYWAFPDADAGLRLARQFNIPSIVIVGGSDVRLLPKDQAHSRAVRQVLNQSSIVATVSDGLRRESIALGVAPERARTIRQGVDPAVFSVGDRQAARRAIGLGSDEEMLLWVGRMVPVKNLDLLISAVASLRTDRPRLRLHLIGDGDNRGPLQSRVDAEGLADAIRFEGPIAHDGLAQWYRAADMTVLSSNSEGLPNVLRESLACGTPFVATDVGDISEIATPELAKLVPAANTAAFARAIVDVLDQSYKRGAEAYVARTWSDAAADFVSLIEELRADRRGSALDPSRRISA